MVNIFFDQLNIEKVNYAVMRNFEYLPESWGNDIDILLIPKELDLFHKIVENIFDKSSIIEIRESLSYRGYYIMLDNNDILLIDVFTDLRNRAFSYGNVEIFLSHSVFFNDIKVLDKNAIYSIIIVKQFFSKTDITEKYSKYLNDISVNISVVEDLLKDSFILIENSRTRLKINKTNFLCKSFFKSFLYLFYYILYKTNIRTSKPNLICFIVPEGIDISSIYLSLIKRFEKNKLYNYVKIIHNRTIFLPTLTNYRRDRNSSKLTKHRNTFSENTSAINYFQLFYYSIDFFIIWFQRLKCKLSNGLLIYDQCIYDDSFQKNYYDLDQNVVSFVYKFVPKPDKIIFVYGNRKVIDARKNEQRLSELNIQNEKCVSLLKKNKKNSLIVHTSGNISATVNTIVKSFFYGY